MFGREAVLDRRHHRPQGVGHASSVAVPNTRRAEYIPTAVYPQHGRQRLGHIARSVDPHIGRGRYSGHLHATDTKHSLSRGSDHSGQMKSTCYQALSPWHDQRNKPQRTIDLWRLQAVVHPTGVSVNGSLT